MSKHYYNLPADEVFKRLQVGQSGLGQWDVEKRLNRHGQNLLPREKPFSGWMIFWRQFKSALIYILLIASGISFFLRDYVNMYVILAAVSLNVLVGFIQEYRAQAALDKLRQVITQKAVVLRFGQVVEIDASQLVPGDIIQMKSGDKVPADVRLTKLVDFRVNEASLTGESLPVEKMSEALPTAVIVAEQKNMAFMGTIVTSGSAEGVVVATGHLTQLGQIALLIKQTSDEVTPLQKKLTKLAQNLGIIILIIAGVIFLIGIILRYDFRVMFTTAVAVAVAAIPEGLVVTVTVILAIGMQRILKRGSLVRKLIAAETLGSTTIICTDKTGTLTEGEMRVVRIITHDHNIDTRKKVLDYQVESLANKTYFLTLKIGVLASNASMEPPSDDGKTSYNIIGQPTEKALLLAAQQAGLDIRGLRQAHPRLEEVPFDSDHKFMATLHRDQGGHLAIYYKGAPEIILSKSNRIDLDGKIETLTSARREKIEREYKKLSQEGLRILAIAFRPMRKEYHGLMADPQALAEAIFVGFVGIQDPLRAEAFATIQECQQAGIRAIMLTGDHRLTAQSIAGELGLPAADKNIIEGSKFEQLNEEELRNQIGNFSVYARINPQDKLRIIDAWQARGEVVAMTGDGINDAPALKSADIGVALGSGTDVAKEIADIVLLDNNFSTIVQAVREGRIIFDNIKKVVLYLMSDSFTEMIIIALSLFFHWPLPLLAAQILWINLVTDGLPNIALTFEPGDRDIMSRKPVSQKEPIINREMKFLIGGVSLASALLALGVFYWIWKSSGDLERARTVVFTAVAIDSLFFVFSVRSLETPIWRQKLFSSPILIAACLLGFGIQLLAIYLPFFQNIFSSIPLGLPDWIIVIAFSFATLAVAEASKWFFIRRKIYPG